MPAPQAIADGTGVERLVDAQAITGQLAGRRLDRDKNPEIGDNRDHAVTMTQTPCMIMTSAGAGWADIVVVVAFSLLGDGLRDSFESGQSRY